MNKTVGIIVVLALIAGGIYFFKGSQNAPAEDATVVEETNEGTVSETVVPGDEESVSGDVYVMTEDSSITYTAQKKFFGKDTEAIEGTTTGISGAVIVDMNAKLATADARVKPAFESGSDHRDGIVSDMFGEEVSIVMKNFEIAGDDASNITANIPLEISINGTTQTLNADVTVSDSEGALSITGTTELSLEAYSLDAPSIANVYVVDDVIGLAFDITAQKQ